jgi:hypothetical protein
VGFVVDKVELGHGFSEYTTIIIIIIYHPRLVQ